MAKPSFPIRPEEWLPQAPFSGPPLPRFMMRRDIGSWVDFTDTDVLQAMERKVGTWAARRSASMLSEADITTGRIAEFGDKMYHRMMWRAGMVPATEEELEIAKQAAARARPTIRPPKAIIKEEVKKAVEENLVFKQVEKPPAPISQPVSESAPQSATIVEPENKKVEKPKAATKKKTRTTEEAKVTPSQVMIATLAQYHNEHPGKWPSLKESGLNVTYTEFEKIKKEAAKVSPPTTDEMKPDTIEQIRSEFMRTGVFMSASNVQDSVKETYEQELTSEEAALWIENAKKSIVDRLAAFISTRSAKAMSDYLNQFEDVAIEKVPGMADLKKVVKAYWTKEGNKQVEENVIYEAAKKVKL